MINALFKFMLVCIEIQGLGLAWKMPEVCHAPQTIQAQLESSIAQVQHHWEDLILNNA